MPGGFTPGTGLSEPQERVFIVDPPATAPFGDSGRLTGVDSMSLSAPPGSPTLGQSYVVKPTGTGAWVGRDNHVAFWTGAQWTFLMPRKTHLVIDATDGSLWAFSGSAWTRLRLLALPATSGQAGKVLTVNAGGTDYELATPSGGGGASGPDESLITEASL